MADTKTEKPKPKESHPKDEKKPAGGGGEDMY